MTAQTGIVKGCVAAAIGSLAIASAGLTWAASGVSGDGAAGGAATQAPRRMQALAATPVELRCSQRLNVQWQYDNLSRAVDGNWGLAFDIYAGAGAFSYSVDTTAAGAQGKGHAFVSLRMSNAVGASGGHSGSMRVSLWAIRENRAVGGGRMNGHQLGSFVPSIANGDGTTRDYLNFNSAATAAADFATVNPPAGRYCLALALEAYASNPVCADRAVGGYCLRSFFVFSNAVNFN